MRATFLEFLLGAALVAVALGDPIALCDNGSRTSGTPAYDPKYGFTTDTMQKLTNIIMALKDNGVVSNKCKVIDCVGALCAYPGMDNLGWAQIQQAATAIQKTCGDTKVGFGFGVAGAPVIGTSKIENTWLQYSYQLSDTAHSGADCDQRVAPPDAGALQPDNS